MPEIIIAEDEMRAELVLGPDERPESAAAFSVLLSREGIRHGIDHAATAAIAAQVGPARICIASGDRPVGEMAIGQVAVQTVQSNGAPLEPTTVASGDCLAKAIAGQPGQDGRTVTGGVLPAPACLPVHFASGDGTRVGDAPLDIIATRSGVMRCQGGRIEVLPVVRHKGNLTRDHGPMVGWGGLVVEGDVTEEAQVEMRGPVYVTGLVAGAKIWSGDRIVVRGAVTQGAQLEALGDVWTGPIHTSLVKTAGTLEVNGSVTLGQVKAHVLRSNSAVVGGEVFVAEAIMASALGDAAGVPTVVRVIPPPAPRDEATLVDVQLRDVRTNMRRLERARSQIRQATSDPEDRRDRQQRLVAALGALKKQEGDLVATTRELPAPRALIRAAIHISGTVHAGVVLEPREPVPVTGSELALNEDLAGFTDTLARSYGVVYAPSTDEPWLSKQMATAFAPGPAPDWATLSRALRTEGGGADRIIAALLDGTTSFFAEDEAFVALPGLLRRTGATNSDPAIIWSLGCSTGQEVFSTLIAAIEGLSPGFPVRIFGMDAVEKRLEQARLAAYAFTEMACGLTEAQCETHFEATPTGWRVRSPLRDVPRWVRGNLADGLPNLPRPHMVFCRNVFDRFAPAARTSLLEQIADRLHTGGVLVLGRDETIRLATRRFAPLGERGSGLYVRVS
jgi:chemotaxis protein methyltransferase CheR